MGPPTDVTGAFGPGLSTVRCNKGSLIGLGKVCGNTETRVISFCFGRQKQAGEGCRRGTGDCP